MSAHPLGTPHGTAASTGILASAGWLAARGLYIPPDRPWRVTFVLACNEHVDTQLAVTIENAESKFGLTWKRSAAVIESTIAGSEPVIRAWIASL